MFKNLYNKIVNKVDTKVVEFDVVLPKIYITDKKTLDSVFANDLMIHTGGFNEKTAKYVGTINQIVNMREV